MMNSYDYIDARIADQRSTAERRQRVAAARSRRSGAQRLGDIVRARHAKHDGSQAPH